jgi:hypothetical protein
MHGIVSLLPQPFYRQVEELWDELENQFGLKGIRITPFPHFSWQIAEEYPCRELEEAMNEIGRHIAPITVRATGLGLFSGEKPVVYLPVVKTQALCDLHNLIWERFCRVGQGVSELYNPEHWVPHISLVYEDLLPGKMGPLMEWLGFQTFNWEMRIDNLAFICEPQGEVGEMLRKIQFTG